MTTLFVLSVALALSPAAALVPLFFWARWLARRPAAPRSAGRTSYALLALVTLATTFGVVAALHCVANAGADEGARPDQKARVLAEGISEAMNGGAFAMVVAIAAALWLLFATWRWHWALKRRASE